MENEHEASRPDKPAPGSANSPGLILKARKLIDGRIDWVQSNRWKSALLAIIVQLVLAVFYVGWREAVPIFAGVVAGIGLQILELFAWIGFPSAFVIAAVIYAVKRKPDEMSSAVKYLLIPAAGLALCFLPFFIFVSVAKMPGSSRETASNNSPLRIDLTGTVGNEDPRVPALTNQINRLLADLEFARDRIADLDPLRRPIVNLEAEAMIRVASTTDLASMHRWSQQLSNYFDGTPYGLSFWLNPTSELPDVALNTTRIQIDTFPSGFSEIKLRYSRPTINYAWDRLARRELPPISIAEFDKFTFAVFEHLLPEKTEILGGTVVLLTNGEHSREISIPHHWIGERKRIQGDGVQVIADPRGASEIDALFERVNTLSPELGIVSVTVRSTTNVGREADVARWLRDRIKPRQRLSVDETLHILNIDQAGIVIEASSPVGAIAAELATILERYQFSTAVKTTQSKDGTMQITVGSLMRP